MQPGAVAVTVLLCGALAAGPLRGGERPDVLLLSVDALRADRLSSYGYSRDTSPNIDRLLASGVRFSEARTVEPLTAPALASMLTSLDPHEHGSTRNGLRVRPKLLSLPKILRRQGYRTAAFVGNWTLQEKLWGMADHFERFSEILNRARWFGMVRREATAEDLNETAIAWLDDHLETGDGRPFFLWVHYVEPHAPYRLHRRFVKQLGEDPSGEVNSAGNRYDSEIAYVDHQISLLLQEVSRRVGEAVLTVFVADHGESLGEHGYWGHGRHVYEATLWIPMAIVWPERLTPRVIEAPSLITDLAPTILGLLDLSVPEFFEGFDWTPVLIDGVNPPSERVTYYQSHRGATTAKEDLRRSRQRGLLEVARLDGWHKEIYRVTNKRRRMFSVRSDRAEEQHLVESKSEVSADLRRWLAEVQDGLALADELPPPSLSEEDLAQLRALGYID